MPKNVKTDRDQIQKTGRESNPKIKMTEKKGLYYKFLLKLDLFLYFYVQYDVYFIYIKLIDHLAKALLAQKADPNQKIEKGTKNIQRKVSPKKKGQKITKIENLSPRKKENLKISLMFRMLSKKTMKFIKKQTMNLIFLIQKRIRMI